MARISTAWSMGLIGATWNSDPYAHGLPHIEYTHDRRSSTAPCGVALIYSDRDIRIVRGDSNVVVNWDSRHVFR